MKTKSKEIEVRVSSAEIGFKPGMKVEIHNCSLSMWTKILRNFKWFRKEGIIVRFDYKHPKLSLKIEK